jgi:hypothetical protein
VNLSTTHLTPCVSVGEGRISETQLFFLCTSIYSYVFTVREEPLFGKIVLRVKGLVPYTTSTSMKDEIDGEKILLYKGPVPKCDVYLMLCYNEWREDSPWGEDSPMTKALRLK